MLLRIGIDGEWDAADFAAFFKSVDDVHNYFCLTLEREFFPEIGRAYAFGARRMPLNARYRLKVNKVQFASPGFTDLAGFAAAMRELREFLQFLIIFVSERKERKISRERGKLDLAMSKVELLGRLYEIEQKYGSSVPLDAEKHFGLKSDELPNLDPLIKAAIEARIRKIELIEDDTQ